jgi:quercetin dioxygenase-like cupin family protein
LSTIVNLVVYPRRVPMPHLQNAAARRFQMHGVSFSSFASSATGAVQLSAWRADFSPDTPGKAHTMSAEETLYVLSGTLDVEIDGDRFAADAGDAVLVPAGAVFRISNTTEAPAQAWVTTIVGMTAAIHPEGDLITPPWAQ